MAEESPGPGPQRPVCSCAPADLENQVGETRCESSPPAFATNRLPGSVDFPLKRRFCGSVSHGSSASSACLPVRQSFLGASSTAGGPAPGRRVQVWAAGAEAGGPGAAVLDGCRKLMAMLPADCRPPRQGL